MMIFNNGKYKSLLAAETGELEAIQSTVHSDHDYRPVYHLAPPTGLLNDPNGLIFDGEKYHIFYQWFPFDSIHGMKHWKHFTSTDFHIYQAADDLIPNELFESHGCYSGGALPLDDDHFAVFYTGNTRRASDNQRIPYQNIAIFRKSGKLIRKRTLIEQAPAGYTEHVRDPKPFYSTDGKIRFVCGAQRQNLTGTAILFEMEHIDATPHLIGEIVLPQFDNQNVFMWECPDLFKLDDKDIFIWSPQGRTREAHQFQNNYHATYAIGKLNGLNFQAEQIAELDQGFDFYAPQTFAGLTNKTQTILFGWVGLPDLTYPTDQYKWHSMLTMPREINIQHNHLVQRPAPEIYKNLTAFSTLEASEQENIPHLDRAYIKFNANNQAFCIDFFTNEQGQKLTLSYINHLLCLDRSHTVQTELMENFGTTRYCEVEYLTQIEIFFDRSVVEIFINGGEKVMTSRFFIPARQNILKTNRSLSLQISYPTPISYR